MDILNDLQNMIDRSSAFAKRNEIELRGNGRESGNVYIIPEIVAFQNKLGEYIYYEQSHKVTVQEPKELKKERGQRATAAPYDDAADESFIFLLEGVNMSSDELADVLQLKESYIRSHWPRIVESYEKQNIKLYKLGRGAAANYGVQMPWDNEIVWDVDALEMMG